MILVGIIIGAAGALADQAGIGGSSGFGAAQLSGAAVGCICVFVGAFLRVDTIGILGGVLFIMAIGADLFAIGGRSGFGWKQGAAVVSGVVLTAFGTAWLFTRPRSPRIAAPDCE
jgi:hypothetical protein